MPINQPYDPRHNPKVYVPKLTEEERRARATPLENLRGLRFRSQVPAAPVEVPIPAESVPLTPAPQDTAAPEKVPVSAPAPHYVPTALEVVSAEFPEIFAPRLNRMDAETQVGEDRSTNARRPIQELEMHSRLTVIPTKVGIQRPGEANFAKALDPRPPRRTRSTIPPAYSNIISFYRLPRRNPSAPEAMRQRGDLNIAKSLPPRVRACRLSVNGP